MYNLSIVILFVLLPFAGFATSNPCMDDIDHYCSGEDSKGLHTCLKRQRKNISTNCAGVVDSYFREHPEENVPDELDSYGVPGGANYWDPYRTVKRRSKPMNRVPSSDEGGIASGSPFEVTSETQVYSDPYDSLRGMINQYYIVK